MICDKIIKKKKAVVSALRALRKGYSSKQASTRRGKVKCLLLSCTFYQALCGVTNDGLKT